MLLSEAIRRGAKLGPQAFKKLFDSNTQASCALGAAIKALRFPNRSDLLKLYPWLFAQEIGAKHCPHCRITLQNPAAVIFHLNDIHRWGRGAIADWVESVETGVGVETDLGLQDLPPAA